MQEQVTAEEIILAIVENMHQCLEPLLYTTWAPSLYHVYLRRADYERLRGLFPAVAAEAKQALDQELESLNAKEKGSGGLRRLLGRAQAKPQRRYLKPAEGWNISFGVVVEDDLEESERYRVEAQLSAPPQNDFDPSHQTIRVRTVSSSGSGPGERFKTLRVTAPAPAASQPPSPPQPAPTPQPTHAVPPPQPAPPQPAPPPETYLRSGAPYSPAPETMEPPPTPTPAPRPDAHAQTAAPTPQPPPAQPRRPPTLPTPADIATQLSSGAPDSSTLAPGASLSAPPPDFVAVPTGAPTQRTRERVYATFTFVDQEGRRTYRMTKPQVVIGRGRVDYWVDIKLKTKSDVSHEHAVVRYDEGARRFQIKDLSTFGTTVNGVRVPSSVERAGSEKRDLERWAPLPDRALIGLADVIDLDFAAEEDA